MRLLLIVQQIHKRIMSQANYNKQSPGRTVFYYQYPYHIIITTPDENNINIIHNTIEPTKLKITTTFE